MISLSTLSNVFFKVSRIHINLPLRGELLEDFQVSHMINSRPSFSKSGYSTPN